MRLDDAGPRTWLLAGVAGWAVLVWLLALAGMGGRIAPLPDDPGLAQRLAAPAPPAPDRLGPPGAYRTISTRPVLLQGRRPQPFSLQPEREGQQEETFEFVLTGVLDSPALQMAILQPAGGGESVRVKVGDAPEGAPSWRLASVSPRAAVFDGPGGERTLELRSYDGGADVRAAATPTPRRRGRNAPRAAPATPVSEGPDEANAAATPDAVEDADAPATPEAQMEAIRKRIEARREQLRREARQSPPPPREPQPAPQER